MKKNKSKTSLNKSKGGSRVPSRTNSQKKIVATNNVQMGDNKTSKKKLDRHKKSQLEDDEGFEEVELKDCAPPPTKRGSESPRKPPNQVSLTKIQTLKNRETDSNNNNATRKAPNSPTKKNPNRTSMSPDKHEKNLGFGFEHIELHNSLVSPSTPFKQLTTGGDRKIKRKIGSRDGNMDMTS